MRFDRTPVRFDKFGEELSWFCILLLWLPTNPHWPQILSNLESYLQNDQKLLPGHRQPESERSSQQIHQAPSGQLPALLTRHSDANLFCAVLLLQLINDVHKIEHVFFFWEKTNNSRAANSSFGCNFFNLVLFAAKRLNCRIIGASWELAMWNHILFEPPVCASLLRWKTVFHVYLSGLSELLISVNLNIQVLCAGISQVMYLGMWLQMKAFTPFARYSQIAYLEISFLAARRSQCTPTYTFLGLWELVNKFILQLQVLWSRSHLPVLLKKLQLYELHETRLFSWFWHFIEAQAEAHFCSQIQLTISTNMVRQVPAKIFAYWLDLLDKTKGLFVSTMPKKTGKKVGDAVPTASTASSNKSEFPVKKFYLSGEVAQAIESNCPVTKKSKMEKERKEKVLIEQSKWRYLCELVQIHPFLYNMECADWKDQAKKKAMLGVITQELNKQYNTEHTGRSVFSNPSSAILFFAIHPVFVCGWSTYSKLMFFPFSGWNRDEMDQHSKAEKPGRPRSETRIKVWWARREEEVCKGPNILVPVRGNSLSGWTQQCLLVSTDRLNGKRFLSQHPQMIVLHVQKSLIPPFNCLSIFNANR